MTLAEYLTQIRSRLALAKTNPFDEIFERWGVPDLRTMPELPVLLDIIEIQGKALDHFIATGEMGHGGVVMIAQQAQAEISRLVSEGE